MGDLSGMWKITLQGGSCYTVIPVFAVICAVQKSPIFVGGHSKAPSLRCWSYAARRLDLALCLCTSSFSSASESLP